MTAPDPVFADPAWLPQQIDPARRLVEFVRYDRSDLAAHDFLANLPGRERRAVPLAAVMAWRPPPAAAPAAFIFHSGFCRSTLLLRALAAEGRVLPLNEPAILNQLGQLPQVEDRVIAPVIALLARPRDKGERVLIKPSNFPNRLIPAILRAPAAGQAILLTGPLDEFLWAIVRKGLAGRQWGRQAGLVAAGYAGQVQELAPLLPGLSDLQLAALGWLLMQNWLADQRAAHSPARLAVLHSAAVSADHPETLAAAAEHLALGLTEADIAAVLAGPVFAADAKSGADYAAKAASDAARAHSPVTAEEIAAVGAWIAELARVSRLTVPLPSTL